MKPALILSLQGAWYRRGGDGWELAPEQPPLTSACRILSDFDNALTGVMAVDARPDFAAAVIEKHLRSEGMIDGEAHVLTHRILAAGGSSRALFTAVPVASWQSTFAWLESQPSVGLLFPLGAALLALAQRHDALLCRSGRQFRFLVSQPSALIYLSATAFSDDPDDIDTALVNLLDQARLQWQPRHEKMSVYWCDLLAPVSQDAERLHAMVRQRLAVGVKTASVTRFSAGAGELHTAADEMLRILSWQSAANSRLDRVAAAAERFNRPIAVATAVFGIGLMAVSAFWATRTMQLGDEAARLREQAAQVVRRNGGMDIPPSTLLARHAETLGFLETLAGAAAGPDPLGFLDDLRKAADQRVRVMRVRLLSKEGVFRVDGVPANEAGSERALSAFLAALRAGGYQVTAEDPANQSQQPGFFSYSVRRAAEAGGVKS